MAYTKFAFNFTLIDQIVYQIITNQFTPIPVAAHLTHFCGSNLSLFKLLQTSRFYKFHFTIIFLLLILKTCLQKRIVCIYIEKKNIAEKNQLMSLFTLQTRS